MKGKEFSGWNVSSKNTEINITKSYGNGYGRLPVELEGGKIYNLTFKVNITNLVIKSGDGGANFSVLITANGKLERPSGAGIKDVAVNGTAWTIQNQANVQGYTEEVSLIYYPETTGTYYVHVGVYGNTENILSLTNFCLAEISAAEVIGVKQSVAKYGYPYCNQADSTYCFTKDGFTLTAGATSAAQKAGGMAVYLKVGAYKFSADINVSADMNCGDSRWGVILSTVDSIDSLGDPQYLKPTNRGAFETVEKTVNITKEGTYYVFVAKWGGLGSISAKNISFTKIADLQ